MKDWDRDEGLGHTSFSEYEGLGHTSFWSHGVADISRGVRGGMLTRAAGDGAPGPGAARAGEIVKDWDTRVFRDARTGTHEFFAMRGLGHTSFSRCEDWDTRVFGRTEWRIFRAGFAVGCSRGRPETARAGRTARPPRGGSGGEPVFIASRRGRPKVRQAGALREAAGCGRLPTAPAGPSGRRRAGIWPGTPPPRSTEPRGPTPPRPPRLGRLLPAAARQAGRQRA